MIIEGLAFAGVGAVAGVLSGLLGVSGGMVTVPCLLLIFNMTGFPKEYLMQTAIGTSLAAMVINAAASTWAHHRKLNVKWDLFRWMTPGILIGSVCGAMIAHLMSSTILEFFFGIFACSIAIYVLFSKQHHDEESERLPNKMVLNTLSFGIAAFSNVLGIGGGVIMVPIFMAYRVSMKKAVATSTATTITISLFGAISYLFLGAQQTQTPDTFGYLYLPAFVIISVVSIFGAFLGVYLTHKIAVPYLKKIFAGFLFVAGLLMLI